MYIVYILQCQKSPKQLPTCLKRAGTGIVLIVFDGVFCEVCTYLLPFLTVAQHESSTRKTISWSVTVYNIAKIYTVIAI